MQEQVYKDKAEQVSERVVQSIKSICIWSKCYPQNSAKMV